MRQGGIANRPRGPERQHSPGCPHLPDRCPMRHPVIACALLAGLSVAPIAHAGVDGPDGRFDDELIGHLAGEWDLVRQIRGKTVRNTVTASWILNHQFMQVRMRDADSPPAYEAQVLIGYRADRSEYVALWADTWGGQYSAMGRGTRHGNAIEFRFEYDDGPFFNTFAWDAATGRWIFRGESQDSAGQRRPFMTDTLTPRR